MDKFFGNLHAVLGVGFLLAIGMLLSPFYTDYVTLDANHIFQWLHVFFAIIWVGLLYYFNFVQIPTMPAIPAELKKGVTGYIAPKALFFFRWAALLTVITGAILAHLYGELHEGLMLKPGYQLIGVGMWLALIMAANVWFVIWPNQKKVLGLVEADDAAKAKAGKTAMIASRLNVMLSIPMLLAMTNMH
ncbi:MAG: hypothetical protein EON59_12040 [Alphaproteobacteria bacterium]|nr:MAG: hypothetical protein EON59_12040 [Alphaproteobacteria bacterium]